MRFASVNVPKQQPTQRVPATELIRRLVARESAPRNAAGERLQDLPADLDQRVRLVGEW